MISTLPHHDSGVTHEDPRATLVDGLRQAQFGGKIAVATHHLHEAAALEAKGVDLVLCPFMDAAEQAVAKIIGSSPDAVSSE